MPSPRSDLRGRRARVLCAVAAALSVAFVACGAPAPGASVGETPPPPAAFPGGEFVGPPEEDSLVDDDADFLAGAGSPLFRRALRLLEAERFAAADSALRSVVARCSRQEEVGRALLTLSSTYLDARNPRADPDSAALMAARYLYRHQGSDLGRRMGETLYVQALDRGADPGLRPIPIVHHTLDPSARCAEEGSPDGSVALPVLRSRRYVEELGDMYLRLDSLAQAHQTALDRVGELEAELERIRRLLQTPDTAGGRWPRR